MVQTTRTLGAQNVPFLYKYALQRLIILLCSTGFCYCFILRDYMMINRAQARPFIPTVI